MPIKYIGRTTDFSGKRLFDLLCRLKNFGVGRMVYRKMFNERYPEPSFYVITKVNPHMADPTQMHFSATKSLAFGMKVFRGEPLGEKPFTSCWKADWRLVPREEEHTFSKLVEKYSDKSRPVVPKYICYPPLMEYMMTEQQRKSGIDTTEKPMLELNIHKRSHNRAIYDTELPILQQAL